LLVGERPTTRKQRARRWSEWNSVKRALISDIHSNLEGLEAVLSDIRSQGIDEIFCLGDIIG